MGYGKTYRTKWLEDLSGNQGTANQVLISTSAGIAWATASTIIGGPYLPLSGGTMTGTGKIRMPDNFQLQLGTSNDMEIYHDGTNSRLDNYNGDLYIKNNADDKDIIFQSDNGSGGFSTYFRVDGGAVETRFLKSTLHFDNIKAQFGDSADLQILHDGSNSYIAETGTGALFIDSSKTNFQINGSTVMNINFDSKVGIGTTNPDEKLRVDGNIKSAGDFIGAALKLGFAGSANITTNDTNEDLLINPNGSGDILMHTTSSGNVGIGTTGPSEKLDVQGNIKLRGTNNLTISSTSNGGNFSLSSGIRGFNFANNNGDLVRIDSSGNVGIGTTSPSAKLEIAGTGNQKLLINRTDGDNFFIDAQDGQIRMRGSDPIYMGVTSDLLAITNTNVGIGTTSPSAKLDVDGTLNVSGVSSLSNVGYFGDGSGSVQYRLQSANNGTGTIDFGDTDDNNIGRLQYNHVDDSFLIRTNNSEAMRIDSSGNVGIGTTSPTRPLHVNSGLLNFVAEFQSTDDKASILIQDDDTLNYIHSQDGYLSLGGQNALSGDNLNINSTNGNVGIGTTSPDYQLEVESTSSQATIGITGGNTDARLHLKTNNGDWMLQNDYSNNGALSFYNSGHRLVVSKDGNVGIGTTSPASKLEVNGTATVDGQLNINGDATSSIRIGTGGTNAALIYSLTGDTLSLGANNATNLVCKTNKDVEFRGNLDLISNNALVLDNANNNNQMYIRNGGSNAAAIQFGHGTVGGNIKMVLASDGKLGLGTTSPAASALLDVSSTTKGVLLPRMSTTQINAISSPAEGLTVYNTVLSTLCFFNGVSWQKVTSTAM